MEANAHSSHSVRRQRGRNQGVISTPVVEISSLNKVERVFAELPAPHPNPGEAL